MISDLLKSDPAAAASLLGVTVADLPASQDLMGLMSIMDAVQQASLTLAINESWLALSAITASGLIVLAAMGPIRVPKLQFDDMQGAT
jgi:hypothetical protein